MLGPVLPLGDIVQEHGLTGYYSTDDSQLLKSFKPAENITPAERDLRKCCNDIMS